MEIGTSTHYREGQSEAARADPRCPACAGVLVPLRGVFRCTRCRLSLCEGCEPQQEPAPAPGE